MNVMTRKEETVPLRRVSQLESIRAWDIVKPNGRSAIASKAMPEPPHRGFQSSADVPAYRWNRETVNPPIAVLIYHRGEYVGTGRIRNLGLHGMFVETAEAFPREMYLQVQFTLPGRHDNTRYDLVGQVVQSFGIGVVLLMDILHPSTYEGLQAITEWLDTAGGMTKPRAFQVTANSNA